MRARFAEERGSRRSARALARFRLVTLDPSFFTRDSRAVTRSRDTVVLSETISDKFRTGGFPCLDQ